MALKVGDLAKRAGLTVRTLHHYDAIGLLSPSARAESGYRLYGREDVVKLHRIQVLKQLGCTLDEIGALLDAPGNTPQHMVARQLAALDTQIERATRLRERLCQLSARLTEGGEAGMTEWLDILELMTMYENYLTQDEITTLHRNMTQRAAASDDWQRLVADVQRAMDAGMPLASGEARALVERWMKLLREMTANDIRLARKITQAVTGEERIQEISGISPQMLAWVREAAIEVRLALLAPYLEEADVAAIRPRLRQHGEAWPPLIEAFGAQHEAGTSFDDPAVQDLARRWSELFRASYSGGDAALANRLIQAFEAEPGLRLGIGMDETLLGFIRTALFARDRHRLLGNIGEVAAPKPSALLVAALRAVHQLHDAAPLVFDDPLAVRVLDPETADALRVNSAQYADPLSLALRTALIVRSRLAEDEWHAAYAQGVRQYVILGAGLDTYAHRTPHADARLFEVDLPAMQAWKQASLQRAGLPKPDNLCYVGVDFTQETLAHALARAGFQPDAPAFFCWLGVTSYLDEADVMNTLRVIAGGAPGSGVVFDYGVVTELLNPMERMGRDLMAARLAERGEPWKSSFHPDDLVARLHASGFSQVESYTAAGLTARYLAGRNDGMRLGSVSRLMRAMV